MARRPRQRCGDCGKSGMQLSKKGICENCSIRRHVQNTEALRQFWKKRKEELNQIKTKLRHV